MTRFEELEPRYMFEELGYELTGKDEEFITYTKKAIVHYDIVFCINEKCFEIVPFIKELPHSFSRIDLKLLQAINKQCEELGWLGE